MVLNHRTLSVFGAALAVSLLGFGPLAQAQGIPQAVREAMAEKVGIPADAPDFDARLESLSKQRITDEMMRMGFAKSFGVDPSQIDLEAPFGRPEDPARKPEIPQRVVARAAFNGGVPLEEPSKAKLAKQREMDEASLLAGIEQIQSHGRNLTKSFLRPAAISKCMADRTVWDDAPPTAPNSDTLVIADKPPLDADQLYGKETRVIQFLSGEQGDADSALIALAQPECLPYRVRVYERRRYVHYGEHALRNFDAKPTGAGKQAIKRSNFKER